MVVQKIKNIYHLLQSFIANIRYGFPVRKLKFIGVTGSKGKTSSTHMIYHVLKKSGFKTAMISTLYAKSEDNELDTGLHVTTPEPWDLPRILRSFLDQGIEYVVIESTSSGLDQNRLFGIKFEYSLITHIASDHLDYHKTWENYARAKFKIAKMTKKTGKVFLNKDHESANWLEKQIREFEKGRVVWFSKSELDNLESNFEGLKFDFENRSFQVPILGDHNFENLLAVVKICSEIVDKSKIVEALKTFESVKGRMQIMNSFPLVIVDFAHTPSSLEKALGSLINIKKPNSKIICVFGCAGQRDISRRQMGEISVKLADVTILTLEDSRTETVKSINDMIIKHAKERGFNSLTRFDSQTDYVNYKKDLNKEGLQSKTIFSFDFDEVQNRVDAIELALSIAGDNDIVFVTGKGHEQSLAIGDPIIEYEYNDQSTILNALRKLKTQN